MSLPSYGTGFIICVLQMRKPTQREVNYPVLFHGGEWQLQARQVPEALSLHFFPESRLYVL
jgi:hypothetical protein